MEYVLMHVRECTACQKNKMEHTHPAGLLQPLIFLEHKWESVSMDFITRLPKVQGKYNIYAVVDRLTKFAAVISTILASEVAAFFSRMFSRCMVFPEP